jgi:hypothetical protein
MREEEFPVKKGDILVQLAGRTTTGLEGATILEKGSGLFNENERIMSCRGEQAGPGRSELTKHDHLSQRDSCLRERSIVCDLSSQPRPLQRTPSQP